MAASTSPSMLRASLSEIPVAVLVAPEADQTYSSSNLDVFTPTSDYLRPLPSQSEGPAPATIATWLVLPVVMPTTATHPGRDSEAEYHGVTRLLGPGRKSNRTSEDLQRLRRPRTQWTRILHQDKRGISDASIACWDSSTTCGSGKHSSTRSVLIRAQNFLIPDVYVL